MQQIRRPGGERRPPRRQQLRVARRPRDRRLGSPVDRRTPAGRLLPYWDHAAQPVHRAHTASGPPPPDARRLPANRPPRHLRIRRGTAAGLETAEQRPWKVGWSAGAPGETYRRTGASGPRAPNPPLQRWSMTLLIVLALLIALDLAAWRWGHDSRDDQDWTTWARRRCRREGSTEACRLGAVCRPARSLIGFASSTGGGTVTSPRWPPAASWPCCWARWPAWPRSSGAWSAPPSADVEGLRARW